MKGKKILATLVVIAMVFSTMIVLNKVADIKFVEEASATTPGIDIWYENGSIANTNNYNILNTSASSIYYGNTGLTSIVANGKLNWGSGYLYLYYPVYDGNDIYTADDGADYNLTWHVYDGVDGSGDFPPRINRGNNDYSFGVDSQERDVLLNHSGLWVIDDSTGNINCSSLASINQTVAAWFWVNASSTIVTAVDDTTINYGDTGTVGITCTLPAAISDCRLAVVNEAGHMVGGSNAWAWIYNQYWTDFSAAGGTLNRNGSTFTNAGTWYVHTFWDVDGDETDKTGEGSINRFYEPANYYKWFNTSRYGLAYGGQNGYTPAFASSFANSYLPQLYNFSTCGPWDPPEYNDTVQTITVSTGEPTLSTKNTSNVYWGYDVVMEINVTDNFGQAITGCTISLRNQSGSGTIFNATYDDIWMNETGNGNYTITIPRYQPLHHYDGHNWSAIVNSSYHIVVAKDINQDGIDEWNKTKRVTISRSSPAVTLTVTNDGNGTTDDLKVNIPEYLPSSQDVGTLDTYFTIYGRSVGGYRAYYGDNIDGTDDNWFIAHPEDNKNISVTGDILYPVGDVTGMSTLAYQSSGLWKLTWTPTKPGGSIKIAINWPGSNNGSAEKTINIINGSTVTPAIEAFTIGEKTYLTVTVEDKYGYVYRNAIIELVAFGTTNELNSTTGTGASGRGENGEYTFIILSTDTNYPTTAPNNITIAASTYGADKWGYTKVRIERNHNLHVNATTTPTAGTDLYAGNGQLFDIEVLADGTTVPKTYTDFTMALYLPDGTLVGGSDAWSDTQHYTRSDEEIILSRGNYEIYCYNNTHDSQGHNATLNVQGYTVTSTPSVLAWLIDQEVDMSFQVNSPVTNGTLTINNMTTLPNGTSTGQTNLITITDGVGTLDDVNATDLGNFTFEYYPDGGAERSANGVLMVTTATATPTPDTIYINEPTTVEILVTHPATGLAVPNVRVGLDHAINNTASKLTQKPDDQITDADGKVQFSVMSSASGDIRIYIKNGSDPNNKFVIASAARKTMTITTEPSVNERGTFVVSAKDSNDDLITDETVSVVFNGVTYTTTTGQTEAITAPEVTESLDYTITATADGYTSDDTSIKIINVPKIYASAPSSVEKGKSFTVKAGGDDGNNNGILVTIYKGGVEKDSGTTVNGEIKFKISATGTYTIEATKADYDPADELTIKVIEPPGVPGFELLTLIAAIGVAFILLRRRRK